MPALADRVKVDAEHRFTGFDAFKKVIASDVDIVMLCTPPGYRPEHFEAAVNAKKHVFCGEAHRHRPRRRAALHGRREEGRSRRSSP